MRARREKPPAGSRKNKVRTRADRDRRDPASRRRTSERRGGDRGRETTTRTKRPAGAGPQTAPMRRISPAASTKQAKARAKARKAKAPKVVRPPLSERLATRLASIDLRPRTLIAKVPFVVLVIGSLGVGLAITLWLSTDAAERSYQLGNAREQNRALAQQKEALERDVLQAQSPPALAEAARDLGMIPSKDTAHLVQDAAGNWIVVGEPKPADGAPPPPLNSRIPDPPPPVDPREVPHRVGTTGTAATPLAVPPGANPEVPRRPPLADAPHVPAAGALPGPAPDAPPPAAPAAPVPDAAAPVAPPAPVAAVPAEVPAAPVVVPAAPPPPTPPAAPEQSTGVAPQPAPAPQPVPAA